MSKKDYVLLAAALNRAALAPSTKETAAFALVNALKQDNPRFDAARFLNAVMGGE